VRLELSLNFVDGKEFILMDLNIFLEMKIYGNLLWNLKTSSLFSEQLFLRLKFFWAFKKFLRRNL